MAAEEGQAPAPVIQKQMSVDSYKWSNRREDYRLLEVIGNECSDLITSDV